MQKASMTTMEARNGLHFFIWRKHRLSCDFSFDRDIEEDEEDGGEVLNWTAKLSQSTVKTALPLNFGFSLTQVQMIEMGTFVPDELISNLLTCRRYTTFIGAVLFADVSGFTPLCETYSKFGSSGAYRLTATLNRYIGAMVDLIHTFGGDLCKFSGDAFLASWHVRINEYMYHRIHDAISCAMHIQYSLGNFTTDVGLQLKVKLAIAAGNFTFCVIGNEGCATYVILGLPILEVKKAESLCKSGDTVVARSAWSFLIPQNYNYQELGRGYVKIKQILYDPKSVKRKIFDFDLDPHYVGHEQNKKKMPPGFERSFRSEFFMKSVTNVSASLRPFIISPVLQQIEASQSLDYLVEMRRVTIMFINLIPNTASCKAILTLVDETYRSILRSVSNRLGLINKVCLFDKDIMFLVVFGLKGYKDKDEATRALRSAHDIHKNVSAFQDVKSISIGITMGTTYCGVVGHPLRKEFTVIGAPVNKAARLMCAFKGLVTCDASVAFSSRLPVTFFEKMEPINLKGIVGPVSDIFKYEEIGYNVLSIAPIIRRNNVIKKFEDMLRERSVIRALVIIGDPRVGKSRVLMELAEVAQLADWNPSLTPLNKKMVTHFCFLQKVISIILGNSSRARMAKLVQLHKDKEDLDYLHCLNVHFDVKFSIPTKRLNRTSIQAKYLYRKTLFKMFNKDIILIDDAEGLDSESWKILGLLTKVPGVLVVVTLPSAIEGIEPTMNHYLSIPVVTVVKLENLPRKYMAPLICQMLDVEAVPRKLIRNLYKISRGIPGWVQAFLLSYVEAGAISVVFDFPETILQRRSYYVIRGPQTKKVIALKRARRCVENVFLDDKISLSFGKNIWLTEFSKNPCEIFSGYYIDSIEAKNMFSLVEPLRRLKNVIMATFDNLTPFKQLMLKCGAILGKEFHRSELEAVMDWPFNLALALGVKNLFEIDILCCASKYNPVETMRRRISADPSPITFKPLMTCHCDVKVHKGRYGRLPKYALCSFMGFRFELLRSTIYQVIPVNQRYEFHMRAFIYVRQQVMKCPECLNYEVYISLKKFNTNLTPLTKHPSPNIISSNKKFFKTGTNELAPKRRSDMRRGGVLGLTKGVTFSDNLSDAEEDNGQTGPEDLSSESELGLPAGDVFRNAAISFIGSCDSRRAEDAQNRMLRELPLYIPYVVNCTCNQIATDIYKKLLYHANAADAKAEKLKILVEYGIHCVKYSNFTSAYDLLREALDLCEEILANFTSFENSSFPEHKGGESKKKKKTLSPKVIYMEKDKAKCYFGICCTFLGYQRRGIVELNSVTNLSILTPVSYFLSISFFKLKAFSDSRKEHMKIQFGFLAHAHSSLAQACIMQLDLVEAEYAAEVAIKYASLINKLDYLSSAYATYIEVCLLSGKYKKAKKTEKEALQKCIAAFREKDVWDILYLGRVFTSVFKARLYRGELYKVIEVAKAALRAASTFRACDVEQFIYPHLLRCLALLKKLQEIAEIFNTLQNNDKDYSMFETTRTQRFYIKLNLVVLVEIGYSMDPPMKIIKRLEAKYTDNTKPNYRSHNILSRRNIIYMWIWYLRRKEFEKAEEWQVVPQDGCDFLLDNIPSTMLLLEGQLLSMVRALNLAEEFTPEIRELQREIDLRIAHLEGIARKRLLYTLPLILHLKGYRNVLCHDYEAKGNVIVPGLAELRVALKHAREQGNIHSIAWIQYSMTEWFVETDEALGTQVEHSDANIRQVSLPDDQELYQYQPEDILYHLPLPSFIVNKLKAYLATNDEMAAMWSDNGIDRSTLFYGEAK